MRILILSDARSIHTKRWVKALCEEGIELAVFSISVPSDDFYERLGVKCISFNYARYTSSLKNKYRYLSTVSKVRKAINEFHPDIVHAHYASSYGLIGALTRFHPYVVSVWGSDVYDFPTFNIITKSIIKYVFWKADMILSTSHVMANEAKRYTQKEIGVTPFGVDTLLFSPSDEPYKNETINIGLVKTLSPKYGIDVLIKAFAIVTDKNPEKNIRLILVGEGPNSDDYKKMVKDLEICSKVIFNGWVPNEELPKVYQSFYLSVFPSVSNSESFGVAAVESMSCGCPVVSSDADGFTEVVENGVTGCVVPKYDVKATASAILQLIDNPNLREQMSKKGRERVLLLYDWKKNVNTMIDYYNQIFSEFYASTGKKKK